MQETTDVPDVVYIVVDGAFGDRLSGLPRGLPVWIMDTPPNRRAAEAHWKAHPHQNQFNGVTTFKPGGDTSAECVRAILWTVDEHHPDWREARVIGCTLDEGSVAAFRECGSSSVTAQPDGFVARR